MKSIHAYLFVLLLLLPQLIIASTVEGNGKYVNVSYQLDDFYKIKMNCSFNVVYHQSKDSAGLIKIYGEENIVDDIDVKSIKGQLNIKFKNLSKKEFGVVILNIYSSDLIQVENDGGSVFETAGKVSGSEVSLMLMGNGQIKAEDLDFGIVNAKIFTGNGDIFLKGNCRYAELSMVGSGEIKAHELVARDVKCIITGNGNIGCNAEKTLNVRITGTGNVYYNGSPEIKKTVVGSGKITSLVNTSGNK